MTNNYITIDQVHAEFGFSKSWVYKQVAARKLKHYKPSKRIYFDRADLLEYIKKSPVRSISELQTETLQSLLTVKPSKQ